MVGPGKYAFGAEQANMRGLLATLRLISHDRDGLSSMGAEAALAARAWTWQESAKKLRTALESNMGMDNGRDCDPLEKEATLWRR